MKYRKKPVIIEAITFDEFVEYGKKHATSMVNGIPWSFEYNGHPVTHENDKCYLIPTLEGMYRFTPEDMLITGVKGEIYPCKKDIFEKTYEKVAEPEGPVQTQSNKFIPEDSNGMHPIDINGKCSNQSGIDRLFLGQVTYP